MRMWMVDPNSMCRSHLLGEHVEIHMFVGTLKRGNSIAGYIKGGLLDIGALKIRHDELVIEMKRRGYVHKSPLNFACPNVYPSSRIDPKANLLELGKRCSECRKRLLTISRKE